MPVETATYISQLDATNPDGDAQKFEGDNHLILIKGVLQNTFPNANAAITATPAELNYLSGVTSSVLHTSQLAALPGPIGTTTPVAGYFSTLQSNGVQTVVESRSLTAGSGLTGGGTLAADRTFNVGAGTGITVAADSISTNDSAIVHDDLSGFVANEHINHGSVSVTAGNGLTGGGTIAASRQIDVGAGTGITVNANDVALNTSNTRNTDHAGVSINVSGGLLSGGGTLASTRTITLTDETIQDLVGAMVSGNTETNITVTYRDTDGTLDFSVPAASTSVAGVAEYSTAAEVDAGSSTTSVVTPGRFGATRSLGSNGYYVFPGGFTIQWGTAFNVGSGGSISFPRAFTAQAYSVVVSPYSRTMTGGEDAVSVLSMSTTSFTISHSDLGGTAADWNWMAFGIS